MPPDCWPLLAPLDDTAERGGGTNASAVAAAAADAAMLLTIHLPLKLKMKRPGVGNRMTPISVLMETMPKALEPGEHALMGL